MEHFRITAHFASCRRTLQTFSRLYELLKHGEREEFVTFGVMTHKGIICTPSTGAEMVTCVHEGTSNICSPRKKSRNFTKCRFPNTMKVNIILAHQWVV
eukprot:scaffold2413_cov44-Attheya_sp.AAC.4